MSELPPDLPAWRAAYAAGADPVALLDAVFARIAAVDDPGIFLHLAPRAEVQAALAALPPRSEAAHMPLWGIPFAVKDNIDVAGMPTTAACPAFAYEAEADAACVARLRAAGAIPIGKTNLDQFATGLVGVRSPYAPPRNALDPAIVPGGSSSGSAVAVAHGIVPFALGTDTAGSGRVPAALNGIVGLKPSLGAISASGVVPACRTLDTVSVFARSVADAHAVFAAAAGYDAGDPFSRRLPIRPPAAPPPRFRIGVPAAGQRRFEGDALQAASYDAALDDLAALGVEIVEIDFAPFHATAELLYDGPWVAERHAVVADLLARAPEAVHPTTRAVIEKAHAFDATDTFRAIYRLAELRRAVEGAMRDIDALCVPTIPTFYTCADLEADPIGPNSALGLYTNFVNLLDLCGLAVPTAPRQDGRPGSITVLARAGEDHALAGLATALEARAAGIALGTADAPHSDPVAGEIALAVVGAHMSGLPLNGELTSRGGRFLRRTHTAPDYRFYALPGGPPARPGLVRDAGGGTIEIEVWALPQEAIGSLLAGIPAPLGLGTLALADGTHVHGFLCEAAGTEGAEDITALGGWRAFLDRQSASARRSGAA